ncbi:MAG: nucleotidyltransferase family protein [Alphaproteobacteria bacterium]|nr:nucleotidyltransferase family protein [Alphaproteobacteria bacterium]
MKLAIIILAAGHSKRFGTNDKLLAQLKGQALAQYTANTIRKIKSELKIAVVSNPEVAPIFDEFDIVYNQGDQSSSLKAGLNYAMDNQIDKVLVCLADMPFIDEKTIESLIEKSNHHPIAACSDGSKISVPAVFNSTVFADILALSGDKGAGKLIKPLDAEAIVQVEKTTLQDIDSSQSLNLFNSA